MELYSLLNCINYSKKRPIRLLWLNWLKFYSNFCYHRPFLLTKAARPSVDAPCIHADPACVLLPDLEIVTPPAVRVYDHKLTSNQKSNLYVH